MSFTKVIKASKPQQSISSFVVCCQQKTFQPQNKSNSVTNELGQGTFSQNKKSNLSKQSFWQNDTPSKIIHRFLLQNIFSLNSLSESKKHDYSEFESEEFVHVLSMQGQEISAEIIQTETVKSQFFQSTIPSMENKSDNQSLFEFQFEKEQILEMKA